MRTNFGFVDRDFKPSLRDWLGSIHGEYFQAWQIDPVDSLPAPVNDETRRAAVWIGKVASAYGDSPIIAVSIKRKENVDYNRAHWYMGVCNFGWDQGELGKAQSEIELSATALENAIHGPASFYENIMLLKHYLPAPSFISSANQ